VKLPRRRGQRQFSPPNLVPLSFPAAPVGPGGVAAPICRPKASSGPVAGAAHVGQNDDVDDDERHQRRLSGVKRRVDLRAWFRKCYFQVTPEIDRALRVKGFLVLGVTLI
jgi:hypothetical protein